MGIFPTTFVQHAQWRIHAGTGVHRCRRPAEAHGGRTLPVHARTYGMLSAPKRMLPHTKTRACPRRRLFCFQRPSTIIAHDSCSDRPPWPKRWVAKPTPWACTCTAAADPRMVRANVRMRVWSATDWRGMRVYTRAGIFQATGFDNKPSGRSVSLVCCVGCYLLCFEEWTV